jgi:preprotein translocase subunit SecD
MSLTERHEQAKRKNPLAEKVIPLGLDLQGGAHLLYQIDTTKLPDESDPTVTRAIEQNIVVINNRIDALGVANSVVTRQGRDLILVQMPGVYESETAKQIIGKTALLEFHIVKDSEELIKIIEAIEKKGLRPEDVIKGLPEDIKKLVPAGMTLLPEREGGYLLVTEKADLTGKYLKQARVEFNNSGFQVGGLSIGFELDAEGAQLFEALTAAHINERLAIVLDGIVQSAPNIQTRIGGGRGQITGTFSPQEAKLLANILNSGNLQAPMTVVEERSVGPELGEDSIRSGVRAVLLGFGLVCLFMLVYYKVSGLFADVALLLNLFFLFAAMNLIKANLTLPGLAGVILSVAMSVDANIIILERVREELRLGKQARSAIEEGYEKGSSAILDGNVTAIIAALFLFQFGPGPVKGFGITLIIGLVISMFTCVWITKIFYDVWFSVSRPDKLSV